MKMPIKITKEIEELDISFANFSTRTYNCLRRAGYNTIENVIDNHSKLKKIRGFGEGSRIEVNNYLLKIIESQYDESTLNARINELN